MSTCSAFQARNQPADVLADPVSDKDWPSGAYKLNQQEGGVDVYYAA